MTDILKFEFAKARVNFQTVMVLSLVHAYEHVAVHD